MTSTNQIPELDSRGLRNFAFTTGGVLAAIFGLLLPWIFDHAYPYWPWIILGILSIWGLLAPRTLRPVYIGWMRFALLLGMITTPIILGIVFYLLFFPVALVFRVLGKDPMHRTFSSDQSTYRVKVDARSPDNLEKPF